MITLADLRVFESALWHYPATVKELREVLEGLGAERVQVWATNYLGEECRMIDEAILPGSYLVWRLPEEET